MEELGALTQGLALHEERVRPEWIDYNGHMNVAYYVLIFDHATDALYDHLGIGIDYRERNGFSSFAVEGHVIWARELVENDPVQVVTRLLGYDEKRIHYFHAMLHAEKGFLAATHEILSLHVDMAKRRAAPMPREIQERIRPLYEEHRRMPLPPQAGRRVGLDARPGR